MPKSVDEVIEGALMHAYDPQKAHEYYMRTRKLKGRKLGTAKVIPIDKKRSAQPSQPSQSLEAQVSELKARLSQLQSRLREIMANRRDSTGSKSDDKKTAADKAEDARESKQYREKHKTEIAQKRKRAASKSSGGGSSSGGSSISNMNEDQVRAAIVRTKSNLQAAVARARAASRSTA